MRSTGIATTRGGSKLKDKNMTAKSSLEEIDNLIQDNISEQPSTDNSTELPLDELKEKLLNKGKKMTAKIVSKKLRSYNFGVIGTGQAGGRLAKSFYDLGYDVIAMNTAETDLKSIEIPDSNKLLLNGTSGGAGKDRAIGASVAEANRGEILDMVNNRLKDAPMFVLCSSLGGGSGSGSLDTLISVLSEVGKPIVCYVVLPLDSEDLKTKSNALDALADLTKYVDANVVSNIFVVDNAKIENLYSHVSPTQFYSLTNKEIVAPLDAFNTFSMMSSPLLKTIDSVELAKLMLPVNSGFSVMGNMTVEDYSDELALAGAVLENLKNNLLASDFDIASANVVGFCLSAPQAVWDSLNTTAINYTLSVLNDAAKSASTIFRGLYVSNDTENVIKVYSWFSGLTLPRERVNSLQQQVDKQSKEQAEQEAKRAVINKVDFGKAAKPESSIDKVKSALAAKKTSSLNKLIGNLDRRTK